MDIRLRFGLVALLVAGLSGCFDTRPPPDDAAQDFASLGVASTPVTASVPSAGPGWRIAAGFAGERDITGGSAALTVPAGAPVLLQVVDENDALRALAISLGGDLVVDARSTAVALVAMHPLLAAALSEQADPAALLNGIAALPAVAELASAVERLPALDAWDAAFGDAYVAAVEAALALLPPAPNPKTFRIEPAPDDPFGSGVRVQAAPSEQGRPHYRITFENILPRYAVAYAETESGQSLAPPQTIGAANLPVLTPLPDPASTSIEIDASAIADAKGTLKIYGPGVRGLSSVAADGEILRLVEPAILTLGFQVGLPLIGIFTGTGDDPTLKACGEALLKQVIGPVVGDSSLRARVTDHIRAGAYLRAAGAIGMRVLQETAALRKDQVALTIGNCVREMAAARGLAASAERIASRLSARLGRVTARALPVVGQILAVADAAITVRDVTFALTSVLTALSRETMILSNFLVIRVSAGPSDPSGDAPTPEAAFLVDCALSVSDAPCTSLVWDFGDDTSAPAQPGVTLFHTYAQPGTYTATLHAQDADGATRPADGSLQFTVEVTIGPRVLATDPPDGARGVAPRDVLTVQFNTPMDPGSLRRDVLLVRQGPEGEPQGLPPLRPQQELSADGKTLTLRLPEPLQANARYRLLIGELLLAKSTNDVLLTPKTVVFRTVDNIPPRIVETRPRDGDAGVPRDLPLTVRFSEALADPQAGWLTLVDAKTGEPVGGTVRRGAFPQELEFVPSATLAFDRDYRLEISADVADLDGNRLGAAQQLAFATEADPRGTAVVALANGHPAVIVDGRIHRLPLTAPTGGLPPSLPPGFVRSEFERPSADPQGRFLFWYGQLYHLPTLTQVGWFDPRSVDDGEGRVLFAPDRLLVHNGFTSVLNGGQLWTIPLPELQSIDDVLRRGNPRMDVTVLLPGATSRGDIFDPNYRNGQAAEHLVAVSPDGRQALYLARQNAQADPLPRAYWTVALDGSAAPELAVRTPELLLGHHGFDANGQSVRDQREPTPCRGRVVVLRRAANGTERPVSEWEEHGCAPPHEDTASVTFVHWFPDGFLAAFGHRTDEDGPAAVERRYDGFLERWRWDGIHSDGPVLVQPGSDFAAAPIAIRLPYLCRDPNASNAAAARCEPPFALGPTWGDGLGTPGTTPGAQDDFFWERGWWPSTSWSPSLRSPADGSVRVVVDSFAFSPANDRIAWAWFGRSGIGPLDNPDQQPLFDDPSAEVFLHTQAFLPDGVVDGDPDGDGLPNLLEWQIGTSPLAADTDGDGIDDARERELRLEPRFRDSDGDALSDGDELALGTDPRNPDSDGDGIRDGVERFDFVGTDPLVADRDSDGDGLPNVLEADLGLDPLETDSDRDGTPDGAELRAGRNPALRDVDAHYRIVELSADAIRALDESPLGIGDDVTLAEVSGDDENVFADLDPPIPLYGLNLLRVALDTNGYLLGLAPGEETFSSTGVDVKFADRPTIAPLNIVLTTEFFGDGALLVRRERPGRYVAQWDGEQFALRGEERLTTARATIRDDGWIVFDYEQVDVEEGTSDGVGIAAGDGDRYLLVAPEDGLDSGFSGRGFAFGPRPDGPDRDGDLLADDEELALGSDPDDPDTNGDGVIDGVAARLLGTDPAAVDDADGDGLDDATEAQLGTYRLAADSDRDGLDDGREVELGTDPLLADSDGDGFDDGAEVEAGSDPLDADSTPGP